MILEILASVVVLGLLLAGIIAAWVFPAAAMILIIVRAVRHRSLRVRELKLPFLLLFLSLVSWNLSSLFFYGPGYYFHHDFGSKVYNEGYIIPHYEKLYGENLTLSLIHI